jgi:hypothetical protein
MQRAPHMLDSKNCSNDPIPMKAIRLSEALEQVLEALAANPKVLETLDPSLHDYLIQNREQEERRDIRKFASRRGLIALHCRKESVVFFRSSLSREELIAYIRDPEDGAILKLDSAEWNPVGGRLLCLEHPYAFEEDFLDNAPFSGNPNTFIRGAYRPIFIWKSEFDTWLVKTFGPRKGGRPKGSGSLATADEHLIEEMHKLIQSHEAKSANDAALIVAERAKGSGTVDSKQSRLRRRYLKKYPSERN